jgi:hypothetical protein
VFYAGNNFPSAWTRHLRRQEISRSGPQSRPTRAIPSAVVEHSALLLITTAVRSVPVKQVGYAGLISFQKFGKKQWSTSSHVCVIITKSASPQTGSASMAFELK